MQHRQNNVKATKKEGFSIMRDPVLIEFHREMGRILCFFALQTSLKRMFFRLNATAFKCCVYFERRPGVISTSFARMRSRPKRIKKSSGRNDIAISYGQRPKSELRL